ncbi:hypothetical protein EBZ38_08580 [bacterium]|nr:hypothetical protein [bacterium]NDD84311.1 hypothetical protein [bacterium]
MPLLSVSAFLQLVTPIALMAIGRVSDLVRLKELYREHVCCGRCLYSGTGRYVCHKCGKIKQKMCRGYHDLCDPEAELVCRITYEYFFDLISLQDLVEDPMSAKLRDFGHQERMMRLVKRCEGSKRRTRWLKV